jgi:hypothetical protein
MGQQQSKDELLFQHVSNGNIEGIKALRVEGAGLEWMDKEGKTPLITACMNLQLYNVAKALIELGANVNAYRPGRHAGTPLHHAAKRGLEETVKLLLVKGANALVVNDECQTPLDVARTNGFSHVTRVIESHLCLFSGWLRELYGPGFLELLAPQLLSRRVWVAVLPCGSRNLSNPFKLELAIYSSPQDPRPRTIIALWKANMDEPNFNQHDPTAIITDISTKSRIKLAAATERDKQQLHSFCDACKGIPQVVHPTFPFINHGPPIQQISPSVPEDVELAMAINASLQTLTHERPPVYNADSHTASNPSTSYQESAPSAPPVWGAVIDDGPIHYPSLDSDPVDSSEPRTEEKESGGGSSCVVCLDAAVEGACIPCGHMAGCMMCLNEIKAKKWGCPVCRAKIDQVIRLYAV